MTPTPTTSATPVPTNNPGGNGGNEGTIGGGGTNGSSGHNPLMSLTPTPGGNISIVSGITGSIKPTVKPASSVKKPTSTAAADNPGSGGSASLSLSNDVVQIALAALIAIVVAGGIIFLFSNMSRQPKKEPAVKPPMPVKAAKRPASPAPKPEAVKPVIKPPPKKKEDLSQDYLYGLVMGNDDGPQEPGSGGVDLPNNGYMKKK